MRAYGQQNHAGTESDGNRAPGMLVPDDSLGKWSLTVARLPRLMAGAAVLITLLSAAGFLAVARPMADDYCRAVQPLEAGWFGYIFKFVYFHWSGRWAGIGLASAVLPRVDLTRHYPILLAGLAALHVAGAYAFCRAMLGVETPRRIVAAAAGACLAIVWAGMPGPGSTVYWFTGGAENLLSVSLSAVLIACIVTAKPLQLTRPAGMIKAIASGALAFTIPGLHELFGIILCVALLAGTLIAHRAGSANRTLWTVALAFAAVGCLVVVLAPGNAARAAQETGYIHREQIGVTLKVGLRQGLRYGMEWLLDPKLLAASLLIAVSPTLAKISPQWLKRTDKSIPWRWALPVVWIAMLAAGFFGPSWAMGKDMPARTLTGVYMVFTAGWLATVFLWTRVNRPDALEGSDGPAGHPRALLAGAWVLLAISLMATGNNALAWHDWRHRVPAWRSAVAQRFDLARQAAREGEPDLLLPRLPVSPRVLSHSDMEPDPKHWRNHWFARYFHLPAVRVPERRLSGAAQTGAAVTATTVQQSEDAPIGE